MKVKGLKGEEYDIPTLEENEQKGISKVSTLGDLRLLVGAMGWDSLEDFARDTRKGSPATMDDSRMNNLVGQWFTVVHNTIHIFEGPVNLADALKLMADPKESLQSKLLIVLLVGTFEAAGLDLGLAEIEATNVEYREVSARTGQPIDGPDPTIQFDPEDKAYSVLRHTGWTVFATEDADMFWLIHDGKNVAYFGFGSRGTVCGDCWVLKENGVEKAGFTLGQGSRW